MTDERAVIARIGQNGHEVGRIRLDQSVEWIADLDGKVAGEKPYIESTVKEMTDGLSARAAIYASMVLADIYKDSGLTFTLLAPMDYGLDPDVIV